MLSNFYQDNWKLQPIRILLELKQGSIVFDERTRRKKKELESIVVVATLLYLMEIQRFLATGIRFAKMERKNVEPIIDRKQESKLRVLESSWTPKKV